MDISASSRIASVSVGSAQTAAPPKAEVENDNDGDDGAKASVPAGQGQVIDKSA
jgi:hypothetical protein